MNDDRAGSITSPVIRRVARLLRRGAVKVRGEHNSRLNRAQRGDHRPLEDLVSEGLRTLEKVDRVDVQFVSRLGSTSRLLVRVETSIEPPRSGVGVNDGRVARAAASLPLLDAFALPLAGEGDALPKEEAIDLFDEVVRSVWVLSQDRAPNLDVMMIAGEPGHRRLLTLAVLGLNSPLTSAEAAEHYSRSS